MSTGETGCLQHVMICNSSDDWSITEYFKTTLDSGMRANEVQVNAMLDRGRVPESMFTQIGPVVDGNNGVSGLSMDGFYLAIQASSSVCVTIERIYIISSVCSETIINLIIFPESYAMNSPVNGQCSNNSERSGSEALNATCESNGEWTTTSSCMCSAGYFLDNGVCSGNYIDCMRKGFSRCNDIVQSHDGSLMSNTSVSQNAPIFSCLQRVLWGPIKTWLEIGHVLSVLLTVLLRLWATKCVIVRLTMYDPLLLVLVMAVQVNLMLY